MRRDPRRAVDLAVDWLLKSGIQTSLGGFYGWYNVETESYPFLYSEATGYGIQFLLSVGKTERAVRAADWLIRKAYCRDQAIRSRHYMGEEKFRVSMYSFDNAVCLKALVAVFKTVKQHRHLEFAWRIGDWLCKMQEPNGRFYAVAPISDMDKWSVQPGCYHAKNADGLLDLAQTVQEAKYEGAARRVCRWTMKQQKPDGRFDTCLLHPHCYATEGLLTVGRKLGDRQLVDAAAKAVAYLRKQTVKRPDVLAQKIRLMLMFGLPVDLEIEQLLKHQCLSVNPRVYGGFFFNSNHVNSWTTIFAIQALQQWLQR